MDKMITIAIDAMGGDYAPVSAIEGIPYSVGEEFEFYYMNDLYYFYPSEAPRGTCTRVALLFEMMKEDVRG